MAEEVIQGQIMTFPIVKYVDYERKLKVLNLLGRKQNVAAASLMLLMQENNVRVSDESMWGGW